MVHIAHHFIFGNICHTSFLQSPAQNNQMFRRIRVAEGKGIVDRRHMDKLGMLHDGLLDNVTTGERFPLTRQFRMERIHTCRRPSNSHQNGLRIVAMFALSYSVS